MKPGADVADVVVVGGRCAGASLAVRLARAGARVIVVDRDEFPSDQPMSTHYIHPHGVLLLEEIGLGERLREITDPCALVATGMDDAFAWVDFSEKPGFCPRRIDLDAILVDAARSAGVDVRTKAKLVDLLQEGGRVVGAVVERDGRQEQIRAAVVVGADGPQSTVAKLTGAKKYKQYESPRAGYWSYWPRPRWYASDPRYRGAAGVLHKGRDYRLLFPTAKDQILVGVTFPIEELGEWRGRHREKFRERVKSDPWLGPVVEAADPIDKIHGFMGLDFFFREAAGPGWALVGDAGLFKDPAPGLGITDALRDAKALAAHIEAGSDAALIAYWRERDVASLELFHFAEDMGLPGYDNAFNRMLYRRMSTNRELSQRAVAIHERRLPPSRFFATGEVVGWTLAELARLQFDVLAPFLRAGKRAGAIAKELTEWTAKAEDARRAASTAPRRFSFSRAESAA